MKLVRVKLLVICSAAAIAAAAGFYRLAVWRAKPAPALMRYANTYDSPQQFMEGIYAADQRVTPPANAKIRGLIVPHHLTAAVTIASGVKMLEGQTFKKVLLLSPDHFHRCLTLLCTVKSSYATLFGEAQADAQTVQTLLNSPLVSENAELFKAEHGIYADVPFIAHYFPGVPVTPLVLSQRLAWQQSSVQLLELIGQAVDDHALFVVSSDFSHYLPLEQAEAMDQKTETALMSRDLDAIAKLNNPDQSDCPGCLWLLAALANQRGFYHPTVVLHTNSATILNQPNIPQTTSHYSMVWSEQGLPR